LRGPDEVAPEVGVVLLAVVFVEDRRSTNGMTLKYSGCYENNENNNENEE
jgi:hypothetical protein